MNLNDKEPPDLIPSIPFKRNYDDETNWLLIEILHDDFSVDHVNLCCGEEKKVTIMYRNKLF